MNQSPLYSYAAHSQAYLERARAQLARFDDVGDVQAFFYCALELRYGIEARVWEYLRVALNALGRPVDSVYGYSASDLLRRLATADPDSHRESVLTIRGEQSGSATSMQYTPVTSELARIHGRLGGLLHYRFFVNNPYWYLKAPFSSGGPQSLGNYRELLAQGIAELEYAVSGALLGNPRFTALVEEMIADSTGSQDPGTGNGSASDDVS